MIGGNQQPAGAHLAEGARGLKKRALRTQPCHSRAKKLFSRISPTLGAVSVRSVEIQTISVKIAQSDQV